MKVASRRAYVILHGILLRIDRIAADRPYHSGKHKRHRMNVHLLADPTGRLQWTSPAPPGSAHDLTTARTHCILDALTEADIPCWADKAYRGAGGPIRVPHRGKWHNLSPGQQAINRSQARIHAPGERAVSILKVWRLLRRLRCSTTLTRAVLALHLAAGCRERQRPHPPRGQSSAPFPCFYSFALRMSTFQNR